MDIDINQDGVTLSLTRGEAKRLGIAVFAGTEAVSRAEYYIRSGLAKPNIEEVSRVLIKADEGSPRRLSVAIESGVETIENPRYPRPRPTEHQSEPGGSE